MRHYLLDKIICPHCSYFPLVLVIKEEREGPIPVNNARPCVLYCAHEDEWVANILPKEPSCSSCLARQVWTGELVCSRCGSHYPIEEGIPTLLEELEEWVVEEKKWWDERYMKIASEVAVKRIGHANEIAGNRYYERNRYLFARFRQRITSGGLVLEIGAGASTYVASLLPPSTERYFYIGTDISRKALAIGARILPEGDFIQCEVGKMPFRLEIFDGIFCLGVLHHIPRWKTSLNRLIDLLKVGGWLLFDEAIEKPRVFSKFGRKHSLTAAIDSPHEGEIILSELLDVLQNRGHLIMSLLKTTPLRVVLVWLFGRIMERSLFVTRAVLGIDQMFAKSAGRIFKSLGPGEVLGIFERDNQE